MAYLFHWPRSELMDLTSDELTFWNEVAEDLEKDIEAKRREAMSGL